MTKIILIRHGQTAWNIGAASEKGERFRGRSDVSLNESGLKQAEAIAERLAAERLDARDVF